MDKSKLPNHVGIIMDGNGRWATEKGLSRSEGHKAGAENLMNLLYHVYDVGIPYLSIYAFSTENFKRVKEEVEFLMNLFFTLFHKKLKTLKKLDVKVVFSGREENIPKKVWNSMKTLEEETKNGTKGVLNICLNYGGQYEIVDMVKKVSTKVLNKELTIDDITKEVVEDNLYQKLPPLDLVIRTSGEIRNSNFMIYEAAYAEYYYPKTYFPDFNNEEFDKALEEFSKRKRRFGGN